MIDLYDEQKKKEPQVLLYTCQISRLDVLQKARPAL